MMMAKASKEEIQACIEFSSRLEEMIEHDGANSETIGDYVIEWWRKWSLFRVTFGYQVLVDNCCDPDQSHLTWKPEIVRLLEKSTAETS